MKLSKKPLLLKLSVISLLMLFTSCNSSFSPSSPSSAGVQQITTAPEYPMEASGVYNETADADYGLSENSSAPNSNEQKIVLNATLEYETTEFEATRSAVQKLAEKFGGKVSSSYQDFSIEDQRSVTYSFLIPSQQYQAFMLTAEEAGYMVRKSEGREDITTQYIDVDSRLNALHIQEENLLQLLEKAENIEDLITIQDKLSQVQYEIENYTSVQRMYDNSVEYSNISIYINEVTAITPDTAQPFASKLALAFKNSFSNFATMTQFFILGLVYNLPLLLLAAFVIFVGIFFFRKCRIKKQEKSSQAVKNTKEQPDNNASGSDGKNI